MFCEKRSVLYVFVVALIRVEIELDFHVFFDFMKPVRYQIVKSLVAAAAAGKKNGAFGIRVAGKAEIGPVSEREYDYGYNGYYYR